MKFDLRRMIICLFFIIFPTFIYFNVLNQHIILTVIVGVILFLINYKAQFIPAKNKERIFYLIFAFIFSFFQVIGYNCLNFEITKINNLTTWIYILLLTISFYNCSKFIFNINLNKFKDNKYLLKFFNSKYSFIIIFCLICVAWAPIIIKFYPGNFAYDVVTQLDMYTGKIELTRYQPVIHTLMLGFAIIKNNSLFLYSIFQAIIMALIFSYTIIYLNKKKFPTILSLIFLLTYMFLPTHVIMAITTTKDVLFSGFLTLAVIHFIEMVENPEDYFNSKKNLIVLSILIFLMLIFRNNTLYALIISIPIILIICKKYYKKIIILLLLPLFLFFSYNTVLSKKFNIKPTTTGESLSVMMQQLARVYKYEELNDEEKETIETLFLNNSLENYNSRISDPIKAYFYDKEFEQNKLKYLKLYLKLGLKYPITYVDAYFDVFYSYFYIYDILPQGESKRYIEINCANSEFQKTEACSKDPFYIDYKLLLFDGRYQRLPILRLLMDTAVHVWIFIITIFNILRNKKNKWLLPLTLLSMIFLTNLLGPVALMRYVYPIFTSIPLIIYVFIKSNKGNIKSSI